VISVPLAINPPSFGYGGGGWNTLDPRVCGDKLCSEIPGGRSAWEERNEPIEQENNKNPPRLSPREQVKNGIDPAFVTCRESLELIFKAIDNSPACVKPESIEKLVQRGWALETSLIKNFEECVAAGNLVMESYPRQCRTSDGKHFVEEIN